MASTSLNAEHLQDELDRAAKGSPARTWQPHSCPKWREHGGDPQQHRKVNLVDSGQVANTQAETSQESRRAGSSPAPGLELGPGVPTHGAGASHGYRVRMEQETRQLHRPLLLLAFRATTESAEWQVLV